MDVNNDKVKNLHLLDQYSALIPEATGCLFTLNCYGTLELVRCLLNDTSEAIKGATDGKICLIVLKRT